MFGGRPTSTRYAPGNSAGGSCEGSGWKNTAHISEPLEKCQMMSFQTLSESIILPSMLERGY